MGFMQQEITDSIKWIEIDSTAGTWFVPADDVLNAAGIAAIEADEDGDSEETLALVADYCEGKPQSARIIEGFGARLSAPGYLDCTDWCVFDDADEAKAYLEENYGDDEDRITDEYSPMLGSPTQ